MRWMVLAILFCAQVAHAESARVKDATFAVGRIWILTDEGRLASLDPKTLRAENAKPWPVAGVCGRDNELVAIYCDVLAGCSSLRESAFDGHVWSRPVEVKLEKERVVAVACSERDVVVVSDKRLTTFGTTVTQTPIDTVTKHLPSVRTVAALDDTYVWLGVDRGEWGGGLSRVRRRDGISDKGDFFGDAPVHAIARAPWGHGCVVAAVGLVHFDPSGKLLEVCGAKQRTLYARGLGKTPTSEGRDPYPSVSFYGLARDGDELVALGHDGVYRVDAAGHAEVSSLPKLEQKDTYWLTLGVPHFAVVGSDLDARVSMGGGPYILVDLRAPAAR